MVRPKYGLKISCATFREFLTERLDDMVFRYSNTYTYVWYREATKNDCEEYYKYTLVYVDNLIEISLDAQLIILEVVEKFKSKKENIDPPEVYLGGKLANK